MDSNISELVKLGHERADELKAACGAVDVRSVAQLISDLASQLEVQYVRAEESQREFRSADITMQNLEAKCEKLAAENACLKQSIDEVAEAFETGTDGVLATAVDESLNLLTPETDAVLKRIQAQGVDALVERLLTAARLAKEAGHEITARDLEGEAIRARFFAMEIRKGVQS